MKDINAIIPPHRLDAVLEALQTHPEFPGVTVLDFGRTVGRLQASTVKLECVLNEDHVDMVVEPMQKAALTGSPGDGKIFEYDIGQAIKIRTGERLQRIE